MRRGPSVTNMNDFIGMDTLGSRNISTKQAVSRPSSKRQEKDLETESESVIEEVESLLKSSSRVVFCDDPAPNRAATAVRKRSR